MLLKKIDTHVHCVPGRDIPKISGHFYPTPQELRIMYDQIGVEKGILLPPGTSAEFTTDRVSPREARKMTEDFPETLGWWFCGIDPRMGGNCPSTDFSHYLNYYKAQGARGVSEQVANIPLDDPRMMNLLSHCEKCHMPIVLHFGAPANDYGIVDLLHLPRLEKVLQTFPDLLVIGHSTRFWSELDEDVAEEGRALDPEGPVHGGGRVVELLRRYPNLWCDISSLSGYHAMVRDPQFTWRFLTEFSGRILFSTDIHDPENLSPSDPSYPMLNLSSFLDNAYLDGKIRFEVYEKISRGNALWMLEEYSGKNRALSERK